MTANGPVSIPRRRERRLLAVLLLEHGHTVPVERLAELIWDSEPATEIRDALRTHVSRLRAILDPRAVRIERRGFGYVLHTDPDHVDASRFRTLVRQTRELTGLDRATTLRAALALWRGPLLADIATDAIRLQFGTKLAELRLNALDLRIEADLAGGRHQDMVAELCELVTTHPSQERFVAHLMLALYRCERQADALRAYEDARRALADDFGVDPGPDLRALLTQTHHTGERGFEAEVLTGLAAILWRSGQPEQALEQLRRAVTSAAATGDKYELAHAHHTIAVIYEHQDRRHEAHDHWRQALDGYTFLGVPEAVDLKSS